MSEKEVCISCNSTNVIKHGKTVSGYPRKRCYDCGKTWAVYPVEKMKPALWSLADNYLAGKSLRELVAFYRTSPRRINIKIREYLEGFPNWEDYLDTVVSRHHTKIVYLTGRKFACCWDNAPDNQMFVAFAIDLHSSVVLGYEISFGDTVECWTNLLLRLKQRHITPVSFLTNGSEGTINAINLTYPNISLKISYHKTYRDRELSCCLSRVNVNEKIIADAIKLYSTFTNKNLLSYFEFVDDKEIYRILTANYLKFLEKIRKRLELRLNMRSDTFLIEFQERLEKFHLIREKPEPLINGLIARLMLVNAEDNFSRLSFYNHYPVESGIFDFACGKMPKPKIINASSQEAVNFIMEIMARIVELPLISNECELKFHHCMLL